MAVPLVLIVVLLSGALALVWLWALVDCLRNEPSRLPRSSSLGAAEKPKCANLCERDSGDRCSELVTVRYVETAEVPVFSRPTPP